MNPRLFSAIRRIWYRIPFRARLRLANVLFLPLDLAARARGETRPPRMRYLIGYGDFDAIGRNTITQLTDHAGLTPKTDFLDVGCGVGRIAIPLTSFLDPSSRYAGFDVVPDFIDWCRSNISSEHPNFSFELLDAGNSEYNRDGRLDPARLRFPYGDEEFDLVYLGSVFTHLLRPATANYIREIARVLRPGGSCAGTFFLLNDESRKLIDAGEAQMPLKHELEGCRVLDPANPEADVGHEEPWVRAQLESAGLSVDKVLYGSWCGRRPAFDYQDILIARRDR